MRVPLAVLVLAAVVIGARPCPAGAEMGFALIGTEKTETLLDIWRPLLDDMAHAVNASVRALPFPDYAGAVWALKTGKAQIAWLGNKAAIAAVDQAGAEVAFVCVEAGGELGYTAQIITRDDSPIVDVDSLLQKAGDLALALGDPNSTSGWTAPFYYVFAKRGLDPRTAFKRLSQGTHEENFLAVVNGHADAAAVNSFDLKRMRDKHPEAFGRIRVIWNSPLLPSDPIVWSKGLPRERKAAVRAFLLQYGRPGEGKSPARLAREEETLQRLGRFEFRDSDDRQLLPIRRLELFIVQDRLAADKTMDVRKRDAKLRELARKIRDLDAMEQGWVP